MSAKQSLLLLLATALLVLASIVALAWRLNPCLPWGTLCFGSSIDGICRLLMAAGVEIRPSIFGVILVGVTFLLPFTSLLAIVRCWHRTVVLVNTIRGRSVTPLPDDVAVIARTVGVIQPIDLVDLPYPLAFVHGFVRPRICVSTGLVRRLDPPELRAVLRHEQVHAARRDPLRALLGHGLAAMLFWLPLARDLHGHLQLASEVEADAEVAQRPEGRIALARALGKLLTTAPDLATGQNYAVSGLTATERRIDALLEGKSQASFVFSPPGAVTSVLFILALICLLVL